MAKKDMEEMAQMSFEEHFNNSKVEKYKCANCGIINETGGGAPKHCIKCDNSKFYKIN